MSLLSKARYGVVECNLSAVGDTSLFSCVAQFVFSSSSFAMSSDDEIFIPGVAGFAVDGGDGGDVRASSGDDDHEFVFAGGGLGVGQPAARGRRRRRPLETTGQFWSLVADGARAGLGGSCRVLGLVQFSWTLTPGEPGDVARALCGTVKYVAEKIRLLEAPAVMPDGYDVKSPLAVVNAMIFSGDLQLRASGGIGATTVRGALV